MRPGSSQLGQGGVWGAVILYERIKKVIPALDGQRAQVYSLFLQSKEQ